MGLGIPELVVIVTILVLIFGANRLPELARGVGRGIRNFKDATRDGLKDRDGLAARVRPTEWGTGCQHTLRARHAPPRRGGSHVPGPGTPAAESQTSG